MRPHRRLGFYGLHGWPTGLISVAITRSYLVGALGLLVVAAARNRPVFDSPTPTR